MVERYPELRFGQILAITEAIEYIPDARPYQYMVDVKDPFNDESVDMVIRMRTKMNKFNKDIESVSITTNKISKKFETINKVDMKSLTTEEKDYD
jgi:chemotaxis regulatin CheY-phosphate phosphatase CheZ